MATQIDSQTTKVAELVRRFIVPGWLQIVLYVLIASCLLLIFNAQDIWRSLGPTIVIDDTAAGSYGPDASGGIWDRISTSPIPQAVFWGIIGAVMFSVIWFIWSTIANLRNDVTAASFVHPKHFDSLRFWRDILFRKGYFVFLISVFIAYIFVMFELLQVISDLTYSAIQSWAFPTSLIELIIHLAVISLLLHVFALLFLLTARAWQSIYRDL